MIKIFTSNHLQIGQRANLIMKYSSKRAFEIENDEGFKDICHFANSGYFG